MGHNRQIAKLLELLTRKPLGGFRGATFARCRDYTVDITGSGFALGVGG